MQIIRRRNVEYVVLRASEFAELMGKSRRLRITCSILMFVMISLNRCRDRMCRCGISTCEGLLDTNVLYELC